MTNRGNASPLMANIIAKKMKRTPERLSDPDGFSKDSSHEGSSLLMKHS